ncbi:hypothetical protein [Glycomyces salinus]|uniref:hypothetical protein n=1 Tax=Glycomyces salinus TaxID=980294 RepID=UPI0018ECB839|nr:hypothetical protein [Glycomyces salinus]
MRLRQSIVLARMLLVFFRRRVLSVGALKSTPVRVFAVVGTVIFVGVLTVAAYFFLKELTDRREVWDLLFDTTTVSVLLWVQVAFLIVKVLFVNADGMLELSFQMPVTNRERSLAFLLYEAAMTGVVTVAGVFALVANSILLLGPDALIPICVSVVLPGILAYLALSVVHQLLTRLWTVVRLERVSGILNILVLFVLVAVYASVSNSMIVDITDAYLNEEPAGTWATAIADSADRYGALGVIAAALAAAAVLALLTVALSPNRHVRQSRYLNIRAGSWARRFLTPYDWCQIRSSHTATAAVLAVALFVYLLLNGGTNPIWALSLLTVGGLYQFTATAVLRSIPGTRVPPWRVFARMLRAQCVLIGVFAVPFTLAAAVVRLDWVGDSWLAIAAAVAAAVMTTGIGVIFPAEKDNPLSVFLGLSAVAIVAGLVVVGLGVLNLSPWTLGAVFTAATALFAAYAIQGIHLDESRRRNEKGAAGHQLRGRSGTPHTRDNGLRHAGADVHG